MTTYGLIHINRSCRITPAHTDSKWRLISHWSKNDSFDLKLINARSETLAEKPFCRDAFKNKGCIIPAELTRKSSLILFDLNNYIPFV